MRQLFYRVPVLFILCMLFAAIVCLPVTAKAAENIETLKKEVKALEKKIDKLEKKNKWNSEDISDLGNRMDKAELHTATDKVSFGVYFRTEAQSLHYKDIRMAPAAMIGQFFTPVDQGGFNGATKAYIQQQMANMIKSGQLPAPRKYDANNGLIWTNKLYLNMKARFNNHLDFRGRLAVYKVFGDSTGVSFNKGSLNDVTFDGNTTSLPHGDTVRLQRAFFVYKYSDLKVPISFSLGRRPSTDGPPLEYGNYSMVGGSPLATIINWQFDGASLNFGLERVTGIPGAAFKLCYGIGYENGYGNATSLNYTQSDLKDVNLFGFITHLYDDGNTNLVLNYAHAWNITDGFTGLTVMPFTVSVDSKGAYHFDQNNGAFISRMEPTADIGNWDALSLLVRSKIKTPNNHIDWFLAGSWTHTDPTGLSKNPYYELMGMGLLSSNGQLKSHNGYSIYGGAIFPMPLNARLGLEYNWGSKYWFNFTGAEDSLIGSKLAVRGQVYEAYYIQPIYSNNFFVKLGGQFYDYKYTGSGNPLGEPIRVSDVNSLDALNPVIDNVWNYYASVTMQF